MRHLILISMLLTTVAHADARIDGPEVAVAVQDRQFQLKHELTLGVGLLPLDAYYKGIAAQLGYTHHFNDRFAWQVARGSYSFNLPTSLRSQLEDQWGAKPQDFRQVEWMVGSDLMWSPLYGKTAGLSRAVFNFEVFLLGGGSLVKLNQGFAPAAHAGIGARIFAGEALSFRLDATDHVVFAKGLLHVPGIQLSAAFNFGGAERASP